MSLTTDAREPVIIGRISGLYGVRGEVKVFSYTRPRERIFSYQPWLIKLESDWVEHELIKGSRRGRSLSALIEGIEDREKAGTLIGVDIAIYREQLPSLSEGEYYWYDLMGMEVVNRTGESFGYVTAIEETGANDVLLVQGQQRLLIPLVIGEIIKDVDMDNGRIQVEWDPEFQ